MRCILRFKRIWLTFVLLGFAYSVFQFVTFTPMHGMAELDFSQVTSPGSWAWPVFVEIWRDVPLPTLEGVAGIFDNATSTYPLSVVAAVLLLVNWRGLHGALFGALRKRYGFWGYLIYFVLSDQSDRHVAEADHFLETGRVDRRPGGSVMAAKVSHRQRGGRDF